MEYLFLKVSSHDTIFFFQPFTSLEMEVASVLKGSAESNLSNDSILTKEEEKALKAMSLEEVIIIKKSDNFFLKQHCNKEMFHIGSFLAVLLFQAKERRAELQKYRALLSYRETKARRQNKIKSKK